MHKPVHECINALHCSIEACLADFSGFDGFDEGFNGQALRVKVVTYQELVYARFESFDSRLRDCLLYTSPSPRDRTRSRMPSSA